MNQPRSLLEIWTTSNPCDSHLITSWLSRLWNEATCNITLQLLRCFLPETRGCYWDYKRSRSVGNGPNCCREKLWFGRYIFLQCAYKLEGQMCSCMWNKATSIAFIQTKWNVLRRPWNALLFGKTNISANDDICSKRTCKTKQMNFPPAGDWL